MSSVLKTIVSCIWSVCLFVFNCFRWKRKSSPCYPCWTEAEVPSVFVRTPGSRAKPLAQGEGDSQWPNRSPNRQVSPCPAAPAGTGLKTQKELAAEPSELPPLQKLPPGWEPCDHSFAYSYLLNRNFQHLPSLTSNAPSASPEPLWRVPGLFLACLSARKGGSARVLGPGPHKITP